MNPFTELRSRVVPLCKDDVDTDQIIPARFLKVVDRSGLAEGLFSAWRQNPDFVLNQPQWSGAEVLLAGRNFGSGSSREHAAWALEAAGFRCVIARSFADIFRNNAQRNGILPVAIDDNTYEALALFVQSDPTNEVVIDLGGSVLSFSEHRVGFEIDPFARHCLLEGLDPLAYLLTHEPAIAAFEARQGERR